jgi:hypothetical protein
LSSKLSRAVVVLLIVGQLIAVPVLRFEYVRIRWSFIAVLVVDAFLATRVLRAASPRERMRLAAFLGVPICVMAALAGPSVYYMGQAVGPLLLGWSAPLAILAWDADVEAFPIPSLNDRLLVAIWLVAAIGLWIVFLPPGHRPMIHDEPLYLLQSQHMRHPPFMRSLDQALVPFFVIEQSYSVSGYINGQYPPGWPLVLSAASTLPQAWVIVFGAYVLLVWATYLFGRVVAGSRVGLFAAVLVTFSGLTLNWATSFMPHVFEAALALIAGSLMVGGVRAPRRRRIAAWALAGLVLGLAIAVRPLTGVALAAALWLWVLLRERPAPRAAVGATLAACAGGVIPIAFLMYYNLQTTGAVLRFGYDLAEHGLHALGFGRRGFVEYTTTGVPVERTFTFGPLLALRYAGDNLRVGLFDFFTTGVLIVPVTYVALRSGVRWRWRRIAAFLVLPLAYFFYFFHNERSDRFYFEIFPFAMVGTAFLVHGLAKRRRSVGIALGGLLAASMLVDTAITALKRRGVQTRSIAVSAAVERLRAEHSKLLVFVRTDLPQQAADPGSEPILWWGEPVIQYLYWYNVYGFPSDVVVARDLGALDTALARRFPERYAVLLTIRQAPPGGEPWLIEAKQLDSRDAVRMQ